MRGKIAMSVIAALLLLLAVGGNAAAAPPEDLESYDAGADGAAFDLQVGLADLQLAAGLTGAGVTSDGPAAQGDAVGLLLAGTEQSGAHAAAPDGEASVTDCAANVDLPTPVDLTDGTCIAGVSASADVSDGSGAVGVSDSLTLSIGGAEITEQLLGALPLDDVTDALQTVVDGLNDVTCTLAGLLGSVLEGPVADLLADLGLPLDQGSLDILCDLDEIPSIVDALLGSLGDAAATTVTITVAPNDSMAAANDVDGVIAAATANGVTVDVLPGLGPDGTSFLELIVGSSEASVVRDATTGDATAVANPAVAEVNVNGLGLAGLDLGLGALTEPVIAFVNDLINTLATASPLSCGEPGPLADILCLDAAAGFILDAEEAAAEGYDFGEGTVGARTSALRLELLSILTGDPAVSLSLAEAVAAANAIPATPAVPTTEAPPTTEETLPRTGSGDFAPLALAAGLGLAALAVRMRRRATI